MILLPFTLLFWVWVYTPFLYFLSREDLLAFVKELVWWCWILSAFACLKSFWFLLHIWMQPMPPCSAPACWWRKWASGLLLCWELQLGAYSVGFFFLSSQLCCPLRCQNSPQTRLWEGFLLFGNFSFTTPSPGWVSIPNSYVPLFVFCLGHSIHLHFR